MIRKVLMCILGVMLMAFLGACERATVSLDGNWELCRTETGNMPDAKAEWTPVEVPSLIGMVDKQPFVWYRRSFDVPGECKGRHLFLRFGGVRFVTDVYVNGKKVGGHYGGWEPFEIDVTSACRLGTANELLVCAQDVTGVIEQEMEYGKRGRGVKFVSQAKDSIMAPVGSRSTYVGIWQPVTLIARNDVYVEDVFVKTYVRKKEIEVDITLRNLGDRDRRVQLTSQVKDAGVALGREPVKVPAKSSASITLKQAWKDPHLWEPEDPYLYHLITKVTEDGKDMDVSDTRFGFREFWTDGIYLVLNGTRMHFLATAGHPRGELNKELSKEGAKNFFGRIREAGCVAMRLHANVWPESWYEAADEVGMPLVMESALFCNVEEYALSKPEFWENYRKHLKALIKDKKNHPAIVMISLENEILHCGGERVKETERRLAEAGRFVKTLDPTRPIMYDADLDPEGVADVINLHYPLDFNKKNLWPDVAYWLETGMDLACRPKTFWKWDRKKPLYFGEFLHIQHYNEADPYSTLVGDEAYLDHGLAMGKAKAIAWTMQIEAYRADDVSGMCPWTLTETGDFPSDNNPRYRAVKRAYQKNAAFIREYDTRFYENEKVDRTVYIYNDTLHPAELTFVWQLKKGDAMVDYGKKQLKADPAQKFEVKIGLKMPQAEKRMPLTLVLRVFNGKTLAFEDSKPYWAFPQRKLAVPPGKTIALFEGANKAVGKMLKDAGAEPIPATDLAKLPKADLLIIGPHALDPIKASAGAWVVGGESGLQDALRAFVSGGGCVIVMEQDSYDCGYLPAKLVDRGCTIAFQRSHDERLFAGVLDGDFKFWRDGHVVCHKTIMKPQPGCSLSLVDSGGPAGLVYLPLCEIMSGKGRYILSQLVIGEKLGKEPIAQVMLENMMSYAAVPCAPESKLLLVQDKLPIKDVLGEINVVFDDVSGRLDKADLKKDVVLLAETDCPEVEKNQTKIRAFVEKGGTALLHGGTRDGFARIQKLFPEAIVAQQSNALPVSIVQWDPAINGLTNQELYWYGSRKGLHWKVHTPLSPDVCRYVIGAGLPDPKDCIAVEAESMAADSGSPRIDAEEVYLGARGGIKKVVSFPQTGDYALAVRGKGTPLGGMYPEIRISIDGKRRGSITTDGRDWGEYSISTHVEKGEREVKLEFVNDAWDPEKGEDRNVWLDKLIYGITPAMKSERILSPAALVKVPLGKGFYLLDQICWTCKSASSEKAGRYIANLLTNLNCPFGDSTGGLVITGDKLKPEKEQKLSKSQDGVLYMGSNGTVCAKVRFSRTRSYQFAVKAEGTEAGGEFPNIDVSIDGEKIGSLTLTRAGWQILRLDAEVPEGEHEVGLSFTNDFYDPPADRNLRIAHLEIQ